MADYGTFTETQPQFGTFTEAAQNPDMVNQDSHSYAVARASQQVRDLAAMAPTAQPTVEKMQEFYDKAYSDAENFKKGQTEANLAQARQRREKLWELTPQQVGSQNLSPIQVEAAQRAQIAQQAEQLKQGPSAASQSAAQGGAFIERESKDYGDKISAIGVDLDGIDRLSKLHDQMTASAPLETGGIFKSWLGHSREVAINTSPDARNYFQLADLLTPTFGKGIQGDLPAATTKANIIEMMDKNVIPNEIDNSQSAHNKWFNLYNQAFDVASKLRDQMKTQGQDTSRINDMLVDGGKWLKTHSDWDPVRSQPLVQTGTSPQNNQIVNTVNAAIGAQTPGQAGQVTQVPTVAPNRTMVAPPSYGAVTYPRIASDPGTPPVPAGIQALVNAPGQIGQTVQRLLPQPGGPLTNALPPDIASPNPRSWGQ